MLIRLADKRGVFQKDVNILQREAMQWLILEDAEQLIDLEKERMKYTILAGNLNLWEALYKEEEKDEPKDSEIEWITPRTLEEIEAIEAFLTDIHHGEDLTSTTPSPSQL